MFVVRALDEPTDFEASKWINSWHFSLVWPKEMYQREVLFNCTPAVAQMKLICKVLGPPEGASWFRGRWPGALRIFFEVSTVSFLAQSESATNWNCH